jgi:hypothetical protein
MDSKTSRVDLVNFLVLTFARCQKEGQNLACLPITIATRNDCFETMSARLCRAFSPEICLQAPFVPILAQAGYYLPGRYGQFRLTLSGFRYPVRIFSLILFADITFFQQLVYALRLI